MDDPQQPSTSGGKREWSGSITHAAAKRRKLAGAMPLKYHQRVLKNKKKYLLDNILINDILHRIRFASNQAIEKIESKPTLECKIGTLV